MPKKIIITGATGLIGRELSSKLISGGNEVIIFSRSPQKAKEIIHGAQEYVEWRDNRDTWEKYIGQADAVIHLAGENVMARRWSENHKNRIINSRINTTRSIAEAIANSDKKPEVFICASATGYYGTSETSEFDESSQPGTDFLAKVTKEWESEARRVEEFGLRYTGIRTGIVLDKRGGALARMLTPFKFYIGGPLGNGKQWFPWIHIEDVVNIYLYALDNPEVSGVLNAVAPHPVTMTEFCSALGKVMHRPSFFHVPSFVLKILFGEGADVLVKGAHVKPKRTIEAGYNFRFQEVKNALANLLS